MPGVDDWVGSGWEVGDGCAGLGDGAGGAGCWKGEDVEDVELEGVGCGSGCFGPNVFAARRYSEILSRYTSFRSSTDFRPFLLNFFLSAVHVLTSVFLYWQKVALLLFGFLFELVFIPVLDLLAVDMGRHESHIVHACPSSLEPKVGGVCTHSMSDGR